MIGLARGTEGSAHLITPEVTQVVAAALCAEGGSGLMEALQEKVIETKRKMMPSCFTCANPCGRTAPFDLNRLLEEPETIRNEKLELLAAAKAMAERPLRTDAQNGLLYQALVAVGITEIDRDAMAELLL